MYESFTKLSTPVRAAYFLAASGLWILTLGGRLRRGRVVVLCYHNVRPEQAQRFERQVRLASDRAIALDAIGRVERRMMRPRVAFTFDDAYANLVETVAPVMQRVNAPWSVYAVSDALGIVPPWTMPAGHPDRGERTMTERELQAIASDDLVEVGAHTVTHPDLASITDADAIRREVAESRSRLRSMTGREIATLALPHGAFDDRVLREARAAGYSRILTLEDDLEPRGRKDGVIARFSASPDITRTEFRLLIDGAYGWLGGLRRFVRRLKGKA